MVNNGHRNQNSTAGRRAGYLVAAIVNLVVLWVVGHLLEWGWPPFLTPDFDELLPYITVSLVATAVVNLLWIVRDPEWFTHVGQIGLNGISLVVAVETWQIFPFDLSEYAPVWETVARAVIALAIFGLVIATMVELVGLIRSVGARPDPATPA